MQQKEFNAVQTTTNSSNISGISDLMNVRTAGYFHSDKIGVAMKSWIVTAKWEMLV